MRKRTGVLYGKHGTADARRNYTNWYIVARVEMAPEYGAQGTALTQSPI